MILHTVPGVIVIQDHAINNFSNYLFPTGWWSAWVPGGWTLAIVVSVIYVGGELGSAYSGTRHGIPIRKPFLLALQGV